MSARAAEIDGAYLASSDNVHFLRTGEKIGVISGNPETTMGQGAKVPFQRPDRYPPHLGIKNKLAPPFTEAEFDILGQRSTADLNISQHAHIDSQRSDV